MAENKNKIRHVLHRRSNVSSPKTINIERTTLEVNNPKAPQFTDIEFGEIAVNYGDGNEALFIRNSENEIVQLNSIKNIRYDGDIDSSLNKYLDERYVNRSGDVIYGDITIEAQEGYNDYPKFKYNGSKFEVISKNLIMDIKETTIDYDNLVINGDNTTMNGASLNENYTTINRVTTTINNTAVTENNHVDTTNFYGDVNIEENLVIKGNANINGDTAIDGNLVLNPNKSFDGKLVHDLEFKIATSATKTASSTITASIDLLKYNNSNAEGYITEVGSDANPLVTKTYVDDVFENILNDNTITTTIDSFKELQDVLGVTNNGEITSTTYNTVISGINAKVNRSGDTMTGTLKVGTDGVTITTSGTINAKSNVTSNGAISATNDITTESKFVGNLNNTVSFASGTFAAKSFNNSTSVTVNVPTDISHLSCDDEPSSWTVFDGRYVNITGDTISGDLTIGTGNTKVIISTDGTIDAAGSIYSSDKKLKKNIKSVSNKDIEAVSKVDLKSYKFINDNSERERYGVIAQDLEKVGLDNLVVETDNKKGVDYISFLILKIAQLEKRIEELEKR